MNYELRTRVYLKMGLSRHAGLEEPAPYLIRGIQRPLKILDVLVRVGSLRLPSVARLEFTPYLIRGRNDDLLEAVSLWAGWK